MFEWDEKKWRENLQKHGVDFADAALIFENPVEEMVDDRNDYGEVRYRAIGEVDGETFLVIYTWRENRRRIISAWKVKNDGKRRYKTVFDG